MPRSTGSSFPRRRQAAAPSYADGGGGAANNGAAYHPMASGAAAANAATTSATNRRAAASPSVLTPSGGLGYYSPFGRFSSRFGSNVFGYGGPLFGQGNPFQQSRTTYFDQQSARPRGRVEKVATKRAERIIGRTGLDQLSKNPFPRITFKDFDPAKKGGAYAYVPQIGKGNIVYSADVATQLASPHGVSSFDWPGHNTDPRAQAYAKGTVLHEFAHTQQIPGLWHANRPQATIEGGADLWAKRASKQQGIPYQPSRGYRPYRRYVKQNYPTNYINQGQFGVIPPINKRAYLRFGS